MPDDGQTYITSFDLHDAVKNDPSKPDAAKPEPGKGDNKPAVIGMKGQLMGKSTASDEHVYAVRNQMTRSGNFQDVSVSLTAHDVKSGRETIREVNFTIKFTYIGRD